MLLMVLNYEVITLGAAVSEIAFWRGLVIVCGPDEGKDKGKELRAQGNAGKFIFSRTTMYV